jgi:hypothetical protein
MALLMKKSLGSGRSKLYYIECENTGSRRIWVEGLQVIQVVALRKETGESLIVTQ